MCAFTVTDPNMTHYLHKHTYTHSDSDCKPGLGGGGGEGGTQDKRGAVNAFSISSLCKEGGEKAEEAHKVNIIKKKHNRRQVKG